MYRQMSTFPATMQYKLAHLAKKCAGRTPSSRKFTECTFLADDRTN